MKRVCLVTYTRSPNYGAALQLFATYEALRKIECDVSVINYQNAFEFERTGFKYLFSNVSLKEKMREYISSYVFSVKRNSHRNFDEFYECMKYTDSLESIDKVRGLGDFDLFCVGSDQVWNPKITDGFDDVFILNSRDIAKKISFASSMGSCDMGNYPAGSFIEALNEFDYISVREKVALEYLQSRVSRPIKQVVDPTFVIGKHGWNEYIDIAVDDKRDNERYVLIYALGGYFEESRLLAKQIAKVLGAKVYAITLSNRKKGVDRIITDATPLDFIRYIREASFVVTNSFHGTCFSMIMNTPFYSIRFGDNPARSEELLATYNIQNRLFKKNDKLNSTLLENNDLLNVQPLIEQNACDSLEWLRKAVYE